MFLILGWEIAKEEHKCKAFAPSFTMLGIILDASGLLNGDILVRHKQDRVEDLCTDIDSIIATGRCLRPLAANMRGKLQYASNQFLQTGSFHFGCPVPASVQTEIPLLLVLS
jgi:hypothetical protein